jgi:hypothetical protein
MSSNYAVLGLSMAAAGVLTEIYGPRAVWLGGGVVFLGAALIALVLTRWLPITAEAEHDAMAASAESAVAALNGHAPQPVPDPGVNGAGAPPLERIATLLEEIEERRAAEATRPPRG